jgi:uncharacterized protein YwgA
MFYFAREESVSDAEKYEFVPYYYGPCSFDIYRDIDTLIAEGVIEAVPVEGQSWKRYRLTEAGLGQAETLATKAGSMLAVCESSRAKVAQHTFRSLLREVYKEYPEYAVESIAKLP